MEFDLGSGTGRLSRKCSLERDRPGTVVSIMRSCGCTDIGVEKGQVLDRGGAFVAAVDVSSKPAGPGKQSAVIELDDGTRYEVTFRYNHKKPAFCDPKYLVFEGIGASGAISFYFPPGKAIARDGESLPNGIVVTAVESIAAALNAQDMQVVRFSLQATKKPEETRGVIEFRFASDDMPVCRLPYLYTSKSE